VSAGELWKISVSVPVEAEQPVADLLERIVRQTPVIYTDEETLVSDISVYCARLAAWSAARRERLERGWRRLREAGLVIGHARVKVRAIKRRDWAEAWKRHFKTLAIGGALLVKPSWSRRRPRAGEVEIVLDPGLSFGTGHHPTTAFCLEQVAACRPVEGNRSLLDVGTGSGILAIAAAKLGFAPVTAFDFDAAAIRVARENARQNGVARRIQLFRQDLTKLPLVAGESFDVVCANLLANLLLAERDRILRRLQPAGRLVLAGILAAEFPRVRRHYEAAGLSLVATKADKEWQSGAFSRMGRRGTRA
jgi:ribosomal protein L11 methyltransferase